MHARSTSRRVAARLAVCAGWLAIASGCSEEQFPQYSGRYRLMSATYSDERFAGALRLPQRIVTTQRMRYEGCCFNHYLRFELVPEDAGEAHGVIGGSLTSLTHQDEAAWPSTWFDGMTLAEVEGPNLGPWCRVRYVYTLHLAAIPDPALLSRVYLGHSGTIEGRDGQQLYVGLSDASEAPIDEAARDEWLGALEANDGITLWLELRRHVWASVSQCAEVSVFDLVPQDMHDASLVAVYGAEHGAASEAQEQDLRKEPYAPWDDLWPMAGVFGQVVKW